MEMSQMTLYLEGHISDRWIKLSMESSVTLFLMNYCHFSELQLVLINIDRNDLVMLPINALDGIQYSLKDISDVPELVSSCTPPVIYGRKKDVRSGLCAIARYIVSLSNEVRPECHYIDLLGFRGGCLHACSEISSWTNLCEQELPASVRAFIREIEFADSIINIPMEIVKLDRFLGKDVIRHNKCKLKMKILHNIKGKYKKEVESNDTRNRFLHMLLENYGKLTEFLTEEICLPHSSVMYNISKDFIKPRTELADLIQSMSVVDETRNNGHENYSKLIKSTNTPVICSSNGDVTRDHISTNRDGDVDRDLRSLPSNLSHKGSISRSLNTSSSECKDLFESVEAFVHSLTVDDIQLVHRYMEGTEMILSDIILYVCFYYFLESIEVYSSQFAQKCARLCSWFEDMSRLPGIQRACQRCRLAVDPILASLHTPISSQIHLHKPSVTDDSLDLKRIKKKKVPTATLR